MRRFFSCVISLLLAVVFLGTEVALVANSLVNGDVINDTLKNADLVNLKVGDVLNLPNKDATLSEYIYDKMEEHGSDIKIPKSAVDHLLRDEEISDFFADKIGDFLKDSENVKVDSDEIVDIIDEKKDEIYQETGYQINEAELQKIKESLDDGIIEDFKNLVSRESGRETAPVYAAEGAGAVGGVLVIPAASQTAGVAESLFDQTHLFAVTSVLAVFGIVIAMLVLFLVLVNWKNKKIVLVYVADAALIAGVLAIGLGLLRTRAKDLIISRFNVLETLTMSFLDEIFGRFLMWGGILMGIGLVLYIIYIITKRVSEKDLG